MQGGVYSSIVLAVLAVGTTAHRTGADNPGDEARKACLKSVCLWMPREKLPYKLSACRGVASGETQCTILEPPTTLAGARLESFTVNFGAQGTVRAYRVVIRNAPELITALVDQFGWPSKMKSILGGPEWRFLHPAWSIVVLNYTIDTSYAPLDYAVIVTVDDERDKATKDL